MKRLVMAAALVAALGSVARSEVAIVPANDNPGKDFWKDVADPHGDEVAIILMNVDGLLQQSDLAYSADVDPTGENRVHTLQGIYGRLRYARKQSPTNVQVLARIGRVADDIGKTHQALEALEAAISITGPDKAPPEVTGRLGMIYLRMGDLDAAIRYLKMAQQPVSTGPTALATVQLATALAMRGQMGDAIDILTASQPAAQQGYYDNAQMLVAFSLAVFYDRDEQRGAAFETIDKMQTVLQQGYSMTVQNSLGAMRFAPAEDRSYYQALLYESAGDYTEARAEWALYAAANGQWRGRALEHIADIDAERQAHPGTKSTVPPPQIRRRRPIP